jgi:hypothetical protein
MRAEFCAKTGWIVTNRLGQEAEVIRQGEVEAT